MQRREFITAAVGMAAAVASASQAFAQDYPDVGAIKKMPVDEGAAGAAKKGIEGEAGAAKKGVKGVIEKITEAIGGGEMEEMHAPPPPPGDLFRGRRRQRHLGQPFDLRIGAVQSAQKDLDHLPPHVLAALPEHQELDEARQVHAIIEIGAALVATRHLLQGIDALQAFLGVAACRIAAGR